ncbi:MAG TPA: hypothetical protein PLF87_01965 [Syntrophorhabdaceae bacterium]|nr:hypothetical protein [Syntrophorhabdaceae bacterium]HNQ62991.1 hypothetical protein [Syntrophorhabdaceae bacterium]HOG39276.1 hypothetical protein [Syntrophorhabdaceae bacterium]HQM75958.1 hypothetical protein [Syntrophorhabdaceae bacterium]
MSHFVPNPRFIEGWHFLENPAECDTREYLNNNVPANPREFVFSPEVGKGIDGHGSSRRVEIQEIKEIQRFGRGVLNIDKFLLNPGKKGCPVIEWLQFTVRLEGGY